MNTRFLTLILLSAATGLRGQTPDGMPIYELEPLIVVSPNLAQAATELPATAIRSAKPVDLAEILSSEMPSAALSRKSPLAGDLVLRGFSRDNVLITVDETRTYCACPNRMDPPAFHVSSQQIESVSVRPGPFSVEQGASVGGAVFVRTTSPSGDPFARSYGYSGSYDYWAAGLTASGALPDSLTGLGGLYYQRGGVYEDGSGTLFTRLPGTNFRPEHQDATAFEVFSAEAGIAHALINGGSLAVNYGFQDAANVLYPGLLMDALADTMHRGSITLRLPVTARLADEVEASVAFSHVDHEMSDAFRTSVYGLGGRFVSRGYSMRTEADSAYFGGRFKASKELDRGQMRYGVDLRRRLWDADNLAGPNTNDMLPDVVADTLGFWTVYERRERPWAFESGARLDFGWSQARQSLAWVQALRSTATNQRRDVMPSVYGLLSRDLGEDRSAYLGLGLATRQPDPQERYLNLDRPMANPDWVGNPDLDPTNSLEIQSGMSWAGETADFRISAFHSWLNDAVYLEVISLGGPAHATSYANLDARVYGAAADAGWNPAGHLRLEAGLAWQQGCKETRPALATNGVLGEIPPLRARLAAIASFENWSVEATVQMQDELDRIDPDLHERPLAGWTSVNLSASCRISERLSLSAGIDNLLDETYAIANSFVRDPFSNYVTVNEAGRFFYLRAGAEF